MKRRIPLTLAAAAILALSACSSSGTPVADPSASPTAGARTAGASCIDTPSGDASKSVKVSGDFGKAPDVKVDGPLTVDTTERTVVTQGDGAEIAAGATANIALAAYNGKTGDAIPQLAYNADSPLPATLDDSALVPGVVRAVECTTVGSRIVAVVPAADGFAAEQATTLGLGADDPIVIVVDVLSQVPTRADGADQPAPDGFPTVTLADNGAPTITIPDAAPPTETKIANLKVGDGAEVTDGANVTVQYTGINWNTKKVFDSSWDKGAKPVSFQTSGVIPGFTKALVGQKVGSQVIAIIPPADGYGEKGSGEDIGGTDTIVFVVDILGTQSAPAQ
ncbi:FKBP-type peptidyl-prolyl cis-trans isomerase [Clavibacter sp. VKM Ac-2873]|uniref:FKBP-type peptidyl-prolyl cis-trans isomerase n=1 Tax=Clavibacter sp. VKM Ac-2873 TaxID=2783813 RepID=UPI00351C7967